jgi:hypothetical protein
MNEVKTYTLTYHNGSSTILTPPIGDKARIITKISFRNDIPSTSGVQYTNSVAYGSNVLLTYSPPLQQFSGWNVVFDDLWIVQRSTGDLAQVLLFSGTIPNTTGFTGIVTIDCVETDRNISNYTDFDGWNQIQPMNTPLTLTWFNPAFDIVAKAIYINSNSPTQTRFLISTAGQSGKGDIMDVTIPANGSAEISDLKTVLTNASSSHIVISTTGAAPGATYDISAFGQVLRSTI